MECWLFLDKTWIVEVEKQDISTFHQFEVFSHNCKVTQVGDIAYNDRYASRTEANEFSMQNWFNVLQESIDLENMSISIFYDNISEFRGSKNNSLLSEQSFYSGLYFPFPIFILSRESCIVDFENFPIQQDRKNFFDLEDT